MARKHHKPEEIVAKLRQVEVLVGQGKPELCWNLGDAMIRRRSVLACW